MSGIQNESDISIELDMRNCLNLTSSSNQSSRKKIVFESVPNTIPDKTVKLKLIFPKHFLEGAKIDLDSKPLQVIDIQGKNDQKGENIDALYSVPLRKKDRIELNKKNGVTSTPIENHNQERINILRSNQQSLPIMGKAALLAKCNNENHEESQVVKTLVEQRFSNILTYHNKKATLRHNRQISLMENTPTLTKSHESNLYHSLTSTTHYESVDSMSNFVNQENLKEEREQSEFDSQLFLQEALGEYGLPDSNISTSTKVDNQYRFRNLIWNAANQLQIILQTSKALNYCFKDKRFLSSMEKVEAERILLLATHRREALLNEITKTEIEEIKTNQFVTICNVTFRLKEHKKSSKEMQLFVLIVEHEEEVFATDIVLSNEKTINFILNKTFSNLSEKFEIGLTLFCLTVKKLNTNDEIYLQKMGKKKFPFGFSLKKSKKIAYNPIVRNSSFTCWAKSTIKKHNLCKNSYYQAITIVNQKTNLDPFAKFYLNSGVDLEEKQMESVNFQMEKDSTSCLKGCKLELEDYDDELDKEPSTEV